MLAAARAALPELPAERAARYARDWGLAEDPARLLAYEPQWGDYFETVATAARRRTDGRAAANWTSSCARGSAPRPTPPPRTSRRRRSRS